MTRQSHAEHPLVAGYLRDLDLMLQGLDPVERLEVVEGVREHVAALLADTQRTEADARAALAQVGPAAAVADEAYAGRPARGPAARPPATSRTWLPVTTAVLEALALLLVLGVAGSQPMVGESVSVSSSGGSTTTTQTQSSFDGSVWSGLAAGFAAAPFLVVIAVLVGITALWTTREKAVLITLPIAAALLMGLLPSLGNALVGIPGVYVGAWTALVLVLVGGGALLWVLVRRGTRRSRSLEAG